VKQIVRQVGTKFSGDALLAGAWLWMEAVGWKAGGGGEKVGGHGQVGEGGGSEGGKDKDGAKKQGKQDDLKKQAKLLLKRQQRNLSLWAAFAAAEGARGCAAAARTVAYVSGVQGIGYRV
jgi:hypothetical protein